MKTKISLFIKIVSYTFVTFWDFKQVELDLKIMNALNKEVWNYQFERK